VGRKPPTGARRIHLYIEGSSKQEVTNAYKEIKRNLDEVAISASRYHSGASNLEFSGQFGKF